VFDVSGKVELPAPKKSFWVTLTPVERPTVATALSPANDDGAFRLQGVPPGSYHLFVFGPVNARAGMGGIPGDGALYARMRIEVAGQDVAGLAVTPQKGVSVSLRLKGTGCKQASVSLTGLEQWGAFLDRRIEVSADKDTVIADLAPSRYQFTAEPANGCSQTEDITLDLTGGTAGSVAIPMSPVGAIRGRLIGGKPADFLVVLVAAKTLGGQQAVRIVMPDADGRFAFDSLVAGEYRIAAQPLAESPRTRWMNADLLPLSVRGGSPTDVELPAVVKP